MKYDEKTGKKIPQNRMDEITLSTEKTNQMADDAKGMIDPRLIELYTLQDISVSMALLVDICGSILNRIIKAEKNTKEPVTEEPQ